MNPTLHFGGATIPGADFGARAQRAASALAACGIVAGDVFALMLHNEPVTLELVLAGRWLGARWCMVNWHFKAHELRHILADSGAKLLVANSHLLAGIEDAVPPGLRVFASAPEAATRAAFGIAGDGGAVRQVEDWAAFRDASARAAVAPAPTPGAAMLYTSGTTGLPKGIARAPATPAQVQATLTTGRLALGIEPGMRALLSAPMYHAAPGSYALMSALVDAELWLEPRFDAARTLALISENRLTHAYLVATMYVRLLALPEAQRAAHDLSSVRYVASTGSPCAPEIKRRMIDWWGPVIHEYYAGTEANGFVYCNSEMWLSHPGTVGMPINCTLHIVDDAGNELPIGQQGTVYFGGGTTFEYHNDPDKTAASRHPNGWSTLGDIGYIDADNFLYLTDRKAYMIITGGVNVYPQEAENVLTMHPAVFDVAVFGVPNAEFGEEVKAVVQPVEMPTDDAAAAALSAELIAYCRTKLADIKCPRSVDFRPELPRHPTGKLYKRLLQREELIKMGYDPDGPTWRR